MLTGATYWNVRSDDGNLCHDPKEPSEVAGVRLAALLRQISLGDEPQLAREELDQETHQSGKRQHPYQLVLIHRSGADVRVNWGTSQALDKESGSGDPYSFQDRCKQ